MRRIVVAEDSYRESLAALGDSDEIAWILDAMVLRIANNAELGERVPGRRFYFLKMRSRDGLTALRLFYWFREEVVYLVDVETYEELVD